MTCYFCSEFVTDNPKQKRTTYDCPACKVGFCFNKNCFTFVHESRSLDEIKTNLIDINKENNKICRTLKDSMKFCHTKMKDKNFKAIFEESGNSMKSVSNDNESISRNKYIMNGRISYGTRKKNKGKISSKVISRDYDFLMKTIDKSLEVWEDCANTRNTDS